MQVVDNLCSKLPNIREDIGAQLGTGKYANNSIAGELMARMGMILKKMLVRLSKQALTFVKTF